MALLRECPRQSFDPPRSPHCLWDARGPSEQDMLLLPPRCRRDWQLVLALALALPLALPLAQAWLIVSVLLLQKAVS